MKVNGFYDKVYFYNTIFNKNVYISFNVSCEYSNLKTNELNAIFHKTAIHTKKDIFSSFDRNIF